MSLLSPEVVAEIESATEDYKWGIVGSAVPVAIINDKGEPELTYKPKVYHLWMTEDVRKALLDLNACLGKDFPRSF